MTDDSPLSIALRKPIVWLSALLLVGTAVWNGVVGDWVDGLFLLGLGTVGILLLAARERPNSSATRILWWTGIVLLSAVVLLQLGLLLRYLFLR